MIKLDKKEKQEIILKAKKIFPKYRWLRVKINEDFEPSIPFSRLDYVCYNIMRNREEDNFIEIQITDGYVMFRYPKGSLFEHCNFENIIMSDDVWIQLYFHFDPKHIEVLYN